ncbi:MAG: hypothetical protein IJW05_01340 [Lentisphaeria bacterium]|nr:hypothetical protein [Lentisphaeria bacterium]
MGSFIHKFYLLGAVCCCSLLCSCASRLTYHSFGREVFCWKTEVLRKETRLIRENGMEGLRMVFCVLPAVFDAATFPFLILIQLYK